MNINPQEHMFKNAKRWLTTGLFGLASSDVGKTMKCKNCGYKF